jgi:hypothetical protein
MLKIFVNYEITRNKNNISVKIQKIIQRILNAILKSCLLPVLINNTDINENNIIAQNLPITYFK